MIYIFTYTISKFLYIIILYTTYTIIIYHFMLLSEEPWKILSPLYVSVAFLCLIWRWPRLQHQEKVSLESSSKDCFQYPDSSPLSLFLLSVLLKGLWSRVPQASLVPGSPPHLNTTAGRQGPPTHTHHGTPPGPVHVSKGVTTVLAHYLWVEEKGGQ